MSSPPPVVTPSGSPVSDLSATPPALAVTPSGTPFPSGTSVAQATPPADLAAVALANPAPGFPVRRWKDDVSQESPTRWVADFGLAVRPELTTTSSPGQTSGTPNGPEVTIFVGAYSTPVHLSGLKPRPVAGSPAVAGVTGHLAEYTEKGATFSVLYFSTGKFTVEIIGSAVTTTQLVALGDALTGLQQPATSRRPVSSPREALTGSERHHAQASSRQGRRRQQRARCTPTRHVTRGFELVKPEDPCIDK